MCAVEISFEQSLQESDRLLKDLNTGEVDPQAGSETAAKLVSSMTGARGFFVCLLTGDAELADDPPAYLIEVLKSAPPHVFELLAKNLVMSSCMAVSHRRNSDLNSEQGSLKVRQRTLILAERLDVPELAEYFKRMHESVTTREGEYKDFIQRWHYDDEQLESARQSLEVAMGAKP
jgi:hypothetical protein